MEAAIISGIVAIACVFISSFFNNTSNNRNNLKDFYSEVFSCYYFCIPSTLSGDNDYRSAENIKRFSIAVEKTSLICSKKSEHYMNELLLEILSANPDYKKCAFLFNCLKKSAKQDVKKS